MKRKMKKIGRQEIDLLRRIKKGIVGKKVVHFRFVTDSLQIYIGTDISDKRGYILWFDPAWHFRDNKKVLLGSYQAALGKKATIRDYVKVGKPLEQLIGRVVTGLIIEPVTNDLIVEFEKGYIVRSFVTDVNYEFDWHIFDRALDKTLWGCSSHFRIYPRIKKKHKKEISPRRR
jgi:hypothetical protein